MPTTMQNFILQFLRSPTWQAHKIASTYEALFDMLATPPDTLPNTVEAFSKRWKVHRDTARKFLNEALQMVQVSNVEEFRQMLKKIGTDAENFRHSPSRVNQENNISNNSTAQQACVRATPPPKTPLVPPTAEEVQAFINQIGGADFTGQIFVDWHTGHSIWNEDNVKRPVWQANVRNWRERHLQKLRNEQNSPHAQSTASNYHPTSREAERQQQNADTRCKIVERYLNTTEDDYIFPEHLL